MEIVGKLVQSLKLELKLESLKLIANKHYTIHNITMKKRLILNLRIIKLEANFPTLNFKTLN